MSAIFAEVKRLMNRSGLSTKQIGARTNINPVTLDFWLDGRTKEPRLENLLKVAEFFGKRLEFANLPPVADTPASVAAKAARAREFIGIWRRYQ